MSRPNCLIQRADLVAEPHHDPDRKRVAIVDVGQHGQRMVSQSAHFASVLAALRHDGNDLCAARGKLGVGVRKGPQLQLAVLAPVPAVEADDQGALCQQVVELNEVTGVVREQERRQRLSNRGCGHAGSGALDLCDEVLVGDGKRPAVRFYRCSEQRQTLALGALRSRRSS